MTGSTRMQVVPTPERPRLELSGEKLRVALETLIARAEEHGGIEAWVAALQLKSAMFRDVLAGEPSLAQFRMLCAHSILNCASDGSPASTSRNIADFS
ncbi:MAG TPA: hypothetical protein VM491_05055, partial [Burkholderiaceae bacterium]|nr:hypothetical protein [Burkholderiaceae bacterium]